MVLLSLSRNGLSRIEKGQKGVYFLFFSYCYNTQNRDLDSSLYTLYKLYYCTDHLIVNVGAGSLGANSGGKQRAALARLS